MLLNKTHNNAENPLELAHNSSYIITTGILKVHPNDTLVRW